ncbi:hypothetical protein [Streptomyces sp. NPDC047009]|uniref:hypothetical protein n=1 Tax=unclassified Streptomyces TaxID=2593676 RepID=UPI0033E64819
MNIDRTKGAQVGGGNVQSNTYLPPRAGARHHSPAMSVHAGDNAHVHQKNTHLKFSIPVIGQLFNMASAHPVIAGATAVALIGGGTMAATVVLQGPGSPASTAVVRGFTMKSDGQGAPTGYDFSHRPPVVAESDSDAVYVSGSLLVSTNGKLAAWQSAALPTGAECRTAVAEHPVREAPLGIQSVFCYLDRNGDPGYIAVTAYDTETTTVDTARLN